MNAYICANCSRFSFRAFLAAFVLQSTHIFWPRLRCSFLPHPLQLFHVPFPITSTLYNLFLLSIYLLYHADTLVVDYLSQRASLFLCHYLLSFITISACAIIDCNSSSVCAATTLCSNPCFLALKEIMRSGTGFSLFHSDRATSSA